MFEALGLSADEESVYLTVLREPGLDRDGIAASAKVHPASVDSAVRRLEEKGLIEGSGEAEATFLPSPPGVALEGLALSRRRALDDALHHGVEVATRLYREAVANPAELIDLVRGADALLHRASHAIANASQEVMVLSRPPYIQTDEETEQLKTKPGAIRRYLYDHEALDFPSHLAQIERDVATGEQARVVPELPLKLVLVDRRVGFIAFDFSDPTVSAGLVVHPSSLLDALIILFEVLWERGVPLVFPHGRPGAGGEADADSRLLALLATGLKDEAVARHLGISPRSLRRRIAQLQDDLGARNRFQAGIQAARRRRVPDPSGNDQAEIGRPDRA